MMTADVHFYCVTPVSDLGMQYIWTTRLYVSEPQCHWVKYLRRTTMHEDNKPSTTKWFRHQSFLPYCHIFIYVNQRRKLFFWTVNERIPDISKHDVHAYTTLFTTNSSSMYKCWLTSYWIWTLLLLDPLMLMHRAL